MNKNSHNEERQVESLQIHVRDAGQHHAGQQVDRIPDTVAAEDAVGQRRQRHHQAAEQAALDAGRDGVDLFRQLKAIARPAGMQLLDLARRGNHRFRALFRLDHRFVMMSATRQQLANPSA